MTLAHTVEEGLDKFPSRFRRKVQVSATGCWLWRATRDRNGYGEYWHDGHIVRAHRFAAETTFGPSALPVLHSCDTPACVNPGHLSYGTLRDNVQDAIKRGRHVAPTGEHHGRCKLTDAQVAEIRSRRRSDSVRALAAEFGVSDRHVYDICSGRYRTVLASGLIVRDES